MDNGNQNPRVSARGAVKLVWKWVFPAVIVKSTNMKGFAAAVTWGPWICLRPEYWGGDVDKHPFVEHEKVHVFQWYVCMLTVWAGVSVLWFTPYFATVAGPLLFFSVFAHNFLYAMSDTYRLWCEVFAYRKALEVQNWDAAVVERYASFLVRDYELELSLDRTRSLLLGGANGF